MPLRNCLENISELHPEMKDVINSFLDKHLKNGLPERQAEIKAVEDYAKKINDDVNGLRKKIKLFPNQYTPHNPAEKIKEIEQRYAEKEAQLKKSSTGETIPPVESSIERFFSEPKRTTFSHRGLQEVATEFGLNDIKSRERISDLQLFKQADETISKWVAEKSYSKNISELVEKAKSGEIFSPEQNVIMAQHIAQMREKAAKAREKFGVNSTEYNEQLKELQDISTIGQKVRSDIGAALRVPSLSRNYLSSLEDAMTAKMEAIQSDILTESQKSEVESQYNKYKEAYEKEAALRIEAEKKLKEIQANDFLKTESLKTKKSSNVKRDFKAERASLKDRLRKEFEEYKQAGQKLGIASDGNAESFKVSIKMAKTIMEIAKVHVDEIGVKIKEVAKKTLDDVREIIGDAISEQDIMDVFAGKFIEKRETESELKAKMRELQTEAKLLDEYNRLLKGGEPKKEKDKINRNKRLTELRNNIKSLKNESGKDSDLQKAAEKIIANNKKQTEKIKERISKKDFDVKRPETFWEHPEFKKQYPKLYKEILDSYNEKQDAKHDFDVALLKDNQKKRYEIVKGNSKLGTAVNTAKVGGRKVVDFVGAGANTTKKIVTGVDDSSLFMQTLAAMTAHPVIAGKAIKEHALDALSEKRFERKLAEIHNSPWWDLMEKSGLDVTSPKSLSERNREEAFSGKTWDIAVKIKGKKYKILETLLSPFERAFTSLGNGMRTIGFITMAEKYMQEGHTFENNPKLFKDLATLLNTETGRGKQNEYIQKASELVSAGIWSPRLMASRLNMLGISDVISPFTPGTKGYYRQLDPKIRKQAAADAASFAVAVLSLSYGLAYAFGGELDDDPSSTTYMDIKFPNGKSYNISGGFSQYIRLLAQTAKGGKTRNGIFKPFDNKRTDAGTNALHFMRGKLTPVAGAGVDVLTGSDFGGQPVGIKSEAQKLAIPLSMQSLFTDLSRDGGMALLTSTLPSFVGINVKDSRDFQTKTKSWEEIMPNNESSYKRFKDANIEAPQSNVSRSSYHELENGKWFKKEMKDAPPEKIEKYEQKRNQYISDALKNITDNSTVYTNKYGDDFFVDQKYNIEGDPTREESRKSIKDLSPAELKKLLSNLTEDAGEKAKEEVFPEPKE